MRTRVNRWRTAGMPGPNGRGWRHVGVEVLLLGGLFAIYVLARRVGADRVGEAFANARALVDIQRWLSLPNEVLLQRFWFDHWPDLLQLANIYYVAAHFPVIIAFLLWGYLRRPHPEYRWARALLVTVTGLSFALHVVVPLAPPRMLPGLGFIDTAAVFGPSAFEGSVSQTVANQYAAMPSLHVGWALLVALVVGWTARGVIRWAGIAHGVATVGVVVVTANHWWLDVLAAVVILATALFFHRPPGLGDSYSSSRRRRMVPASAPA